MFIGLTGSIAVGKSTVSKILVEKHNTFIVDADVISKELCEPGNIVYSSLILSFETEGTTSKYLNEDLTINRKALADRMFHNPEEKIKIEQLMHRNIIQEMIIRGSKAYLTQQYKFIVYDVPLLFEVGFEEFVQKTIVVDIEPQLQIERLMKRNGFSQEEALIRINSQMSRDEKLEKADYVINNNRTEKKLYKEVKSVMNELVNDYIDELNNFKN